ncbi:tagaturonate epimerase family protein [Treponema sp.]
MKKLGRFSFGVGDRFGQEGQAQIAAAIAIQKETGIHIDLVWNKSKREHSIIGTSPIDQRKAADAAVKAANYKGTYFVDADHIGAASLGPFLDQCDFYTIDVADFIGKKSDSKVISAFVEKHRNLIGTLRVEGIARGIEITEEFLRSVAERYLAAAAEAGVVFRTIEAHRGRGNFIAEVSMDETETVQTPAELLIILASLADEGIDLKTIAPKFSGRFNKGVDYVGNVAAFLKEFEEDVRIATYAAKTFGLDAGLKLSVHSGSDKFSLYPGIARIAQETGAGFHLKTAGTTWLEELVGLAEAGGEGLGIAKTVYRQAYDRFDELVLPYASVVDIKRESLPKPDAVDAWTAEQYAQSLRHVQSNEHFDINLRQLLHVGYKVAAEMGESYISVLGSCREHVARNVTENLLDRHFRPLLKR